MRKGLLQYFSIVIVGIVIFNTAQAQAGLCPYNLDFEQGDFMGWECRIGSVFINARGLNDTSWQPGINPIPGRHTMISAASAGTDFYGGFSEMCPNGSQYCVKLGNTTVGSPKAEMISYTYSIPASANVFSILFWYAIVLNVPSLHLNSNHDSELLFMM